MELSDWTVRFAPGLSVPLPTLPVDVMWSLLLTDVIKSKERAVPFDFLDAAINGEFPFAPAPKTTPPKLVLLVKPAYKTELVNPFKPSLEEPPTSRVTCGSLAEMPTLPDDVMLSFPEPEVISISPVVFTIFKLELSCTIWALSFVPKNT